MSHFTNKVARLYHTLKPLKFEQVWYRLYYKLKKAKAKHVEVSEHANWTWQSNPYLSRSFIANNEVIFLNKRMNFEGPLDWNCSEQPKLWLYNLHYFDDLNAINSEERTELQVAFINDWISNNPYGIGNGWEPYTISLRVVNWVKWLSRREVITKRYLTSLHLQVNSLYQQLEYHILGNHLFANAKALIFAGSFLKGGDAEIFLSKGIKIVDKEIDEQFLSDGAHFELSPMYHQILLIDLLELIQLANISKEKALVSRVETWRNIAQKAIFWLRRMVHPDGDISFFNDAAFGIAAAPAFIFNYAKSLGLKTDISHSKLVTLRHSGYSHIYFPMYELIFDHANIGPDYLPGHAHADTLSFELSVGKQRVFVNSGTSLYGVSEERQRQRSTSAHNTVEVAKSDSSEVWSGFRVAKRAYATLVRDEETNGAVHLEAYHDGYLRLPAKAIHARKLLCTKDLLKITDTVDTNSQKMFVLHLHPDAMAKLLSPCKVLVEFTSIMPRSIVVEFSESVELVASTWHPRFGQSIKNTKIVCGFNTSVMTTHITIQQETK